jgi:predicted ATPase
MLLTIVLIDPDPQRRSALALRLESAGHQVIASAEPSEVDPDALPDLVVLVGSVPASDRRSLRTRLPEVPIVVMGPVTESGLQTTALAKSSARKPLPPLIGRNEELADLVALFALGTRVVTLLGPSGVGKTALARHVAARTRGAAYCDLGWARSADDVIDAVAEALGAPLPGVDAEAVGRFLTERRGGLVVLDEVDSAVETLATLVGQWRLVAPDTRFLVTGRDRLHLQGEHCVDLQPLDEAHAIALLLEGARSRQESFATETEEAEALGGVVSILQGLPLALELAAASAQGPSARALLEALFASAQNTWRSASPLRVALDLAWAQLSDSEHRAMCQLVVFPGGFDLEAAGALLHRPDAAEMVRGLVDRALVQTAGGGPDALRHNLHEAVRGYAANQAPPGLVERGRTWHAFYYLEVGQRRARAAEGPDREGAIEALRADQHHTRDAFRALADPSPSDAGAILLTLEPVWERDGASSADLERLREAAERSGVTPAMRAGLLSVLALALDRAGRRQEAEVQGGHALSAAQAALGADHPFLRAAEDLLAESGSRSETRLALRLVRLAVQPGD